MTATMHQNVESRVDQPSGPRAKPQTTDLTRSESQAPPTVDAERSGQPAPQNFWRAGIAIVAAVTLLILFAVWIPLWIAYDDPIGGLGVAAFSAVWGGPGFGTMIAGVIWTQRTDEGSTHDGAGHS